MQMLPPLLNVEEFGQQLGLELLVGEKKEKKKMDPNPQTPGMEIKGAIDEIEV